MADKTINSGRINRRCGWCGIRLTLLRIALLRRLCRICARAVARNRPSPPFPDMGRADHHEPLAVLPARAPRPRARWWRRLLCQHCFHLLVANGSYCCECGSIARGGLPVSSCLPCDVGGRRR